jgi:erythritol transport system ATP-binding protein
VAENIFLAREIVSRGMIDSRRQAERARELLGRLEQPIDPGTLVGDLPLGLQQIVEIAKALARDVRVLMMDEPTSALSGAEIAILFRIIRDLATRGVAIVYISHRIEELLEVADSVSILRDGRMVAERPAAGADARWIVEQMTGRAAAVSACASPVAAGPELLRSESIALNSPTGRPVLRGISFALRAGEVLGIYGLMGAGRTELLECLIGLHPEAAGSVFLDSRRVDSLDTAARIDAGLAMAPEDRQFSGLIQTLSVRANITVSSLGALARGPWLSPSREDAAASRVAAELRIKAPGLSHNIGSLSGGNQQKVVIAKCLLTNPRVLLLDEPTRGVDVAAKREIHAIVRELAAAGMAVVVVSSEIEEIFAVSSRILAMSRGAITGEFTAASASAESLASAASGHPGGSIGETHGNRAN